jgi:hypothetical protein
MAEVRALDGDHPDLISIGMELDAAQHAHEQRPRRGRWLAAAAVFGGMMLGASYLEESPALRSSGAVAVARLIDATVPEPISVVEISPEAFLAAAQDPAETVADAAIPEPVPVSTPPTVERETPIVATSGRTADGIRSAAPPAVAAASDTPARPAPPAVTPAERPAVPPPSAPLPPSRDVVTAALTPRESPERMRDALPGAAVPAATASATGAAPPISPAPPTSAPDSAPEATAPGASRPAVSRAVNSPVVVRAAVPDEQLVRETLQRYRAAYETLDVNGAREVWPAVNESALARAFDGLQSQRLTFDDCNVELSGPAARAECHGSARYVPKVGSREPRVESRVWNFTLRKSGEAWHIETARAAR